MGPFKQRVSLVAQMEKSLPEMQETWVRSLGWEDPLEKGVSTHSSILALENSMDRGAWRATVYGVAELDMTEWLSFSLNRELSKEIDRLLNFFCIWDSC